MIHDWEWTEECVPVHVSPHPTHNWIIALAHFAPFATLSFPVVVDFGKLVELIVQIFALEANRNISFFLTIIFVL